ncbi:hypothetical protein DRH14_00075 [Candidatus Shapirobacteria bacterium]|nr:MAG: hypothetical protein DRH14_00075 [Candidatus Shapirobacteria bacterium]
MFKNILTSPVLAQVNIGSDTPLGTGSLGSKYPNFASLLNILVKNSITVISVILVVLLIVGGLIYIISAGSQDQKNTEKGLKIVQSAVTGFVVVFLSYVIVQIVQVITGLEILNPTI